MTDSCRSDCPACRLSGVLRRMGTGKTVLASFVLWLIATVLINGKPFGLAQLQEITGGPTILDMTFTTGPNSVYAVLSALGDAGRVFDLTHIVPLDLVFPLTYGLFLAVGISWALSRLLPEESPLFLLNLAPIFAAAADYCENAGVITLLLTYPAQLDSVAWFVSIMYIIKFFFSVVSFVTLIIALVGCVVLVLAHRPGRGTSL
ncbi:MAG TPA: hypothetical protein VN372_12080 [Methanospirillum sp.]|nr:hypothetical protein [Methanospirillum sp.]